MLRKLFLLFYICLSLTVVACENNNQPLSSTNEFAKAEKCSDISIMMPETLGQSPRWEERDRPALESSIIAIFEKEEGVTLRYFNAADDFSTQQKQATLALERGSCILVVAPVSSKGASGIVQSAKNKSFPVIAYDRAIEGSDLAYFISFDSKKVGELQGQAIIDFINKNPSEPGVAKKMLMIHGSPDDTNAGLYKQGAKEKLQPLIESKQLELVDEVDIDKWDPNEAAKKAEEVFNKHSDIQIIYVANDKMANAIIEKIIKPRGLRSGEFFITGQDATASGCQNIRDGYQGMTVYKPSDELAKETARVIKDLRSNSLDRKDNERLLEPTAITDVSQLDCNK